MDIKKVLALWGIILMMIPLTCCNNREMVKKDRISTGWIKEFQEAKGIKKQELQKKIVEKVFTDAKKQEWIGMSSMSTVDILHGDLLGDQEKEAIVIISTGPKNTLIAVYEKVGKNYKYVDIVDTFFEVKNIQLIPIGESGKELLVIREYANQMVGAFEVSTFIRAYIWTGTDFALVLNITEDYRAYWNELWDGKKSKEESRWLRIMQNTNLKWENSSYPVVRVLDRQTYATSTITNSVNIPEEGQFEVMKIREVPQTYYWSGKWQHFIQGEGIDSKTGNIVAILEDLSASPYQMVGLANESYRIKRQNNAVEVVPKDLIRPVEPVKKTPLQV